MELGLSLGESPCRTLPLVVDKGGRSADALGFPVGGGRRSIMVEGMRGAGDGGSRDTDCLSREGSDSVGQPVQLELLPLRPVPRSSPPVQAWQGENGKDHVSWWFFLAGELSTVVNLLGRFISKGYLLLNLTRLLTGRR